MSSIVTSAFELHAEHFSIAAPVFETASFDRVFVDAVLQHRQPGRIWVDDLADPTSAFMARTYDYFLAGEPSANLRQFICEAPAEAGVFSHASKSESSNGPAFYGYVPMTEAWAATLLNDLQPAIESIGRRAFRFDPGEREFRHPAGGQLPPGFALVDLDARLAERADLELDEVIGLFWGDYERFAQGGFGAVVMQGNQLCSVAFAVAVSATEVNLGVGTHEAFRRRGLATIASSACVAMALQRGLSPTWDCDTVNPASGDLALKLGFVEEPEFVELAYPMRAAPATSAGLWLGDPGDGFTAWRRLPTT